MTRIWPGQPNPLGATWDGSGTNFAIFSEHADKVELCLFPNVRAKQESARMLLPEQTDMVWHGYLPDLQPGQMYGYRVHGPYEPQNGHRFNPNKFVLDPYAKAVVRKTKWSDTKFSYRIGDPEADLSFDVRDNAAFAPLGTVIDPAFTWGTTARPRFRGIIRCSTNCTSYAPQRQLVEHGGNRIERADPAMPRLPLRRCRRDAVCPRRLATCPQFRPPWCSVAIHHRRRENPITKPLPTTRSFRIVGILGSVLHLLQFRQFLEANGTERGSTGCLNRCRVSDKKPQDASGVSVHVIFDSDISDLPSPSGGFLRLRHPG